MAGTLQSHPMIMGLILSTMSMVEKENRGIFTLAGRPAADITEAEKAAMADAAMQLAILCGNVKLARALGIAGGKMKLAFDSLFSLSLPCPGLALCFPGVLEQNFTIIDQRFVLQEGSPKRRLAGHASLHIQVHSYTAIL